MDHPVARGRSFPLGATLRDGGANFSVFSKHSTGVELCLFDGVGDARPARVIALDPRTQWHGVKLNSPDWSEPSHTIAANLLWDRLLLHVINAYWGPLEFELPPLTEPHEPWRRCIDTFLAPPEDVCPLDDGPVVPLPTYRAQPRSLVILFAKMRTDAAHP